MSRGPLGVGIAESQSIAKPHLGLSSNQDMMLCLSGDFMIALIIYSVLAAFFGPMNMALGLQVGLRDRYVFTIAGFVMIFVSMPTTSLSVDSASMVFTLAAASAIAAFVLDADELSTFRSNAVVSSLAPLMLAASIFICYPSALSILTAVEILSVSLALMVVSVRTRYDHFAMNAFFWASAASAFALLVGMASLLIGGAATACSLWSFEISSSYSESVFAVGIFLGTLTKLGAQPFAWWVRSFYVGLSTQTLFVYLTTFYLINLFLLLSLFSIAVSMPVAAATIIKLLAPTFIAWAYVTWVGGLSRGTLEDFLIVGTSSTVFLLALSQL